MKTGIIFLMIFCGLTSAQNQKVGIDTNNPTRMLDVNGDLRITGTSNVTNNTAYDRIVSANNTTGNVDFINISSIPQTTTNNVEVRKSIYNATAPDGTKECNCGDITFRISGTGIPEFKFNSLTVFTTNNNVTNFDIGYGIKSWSNATYNFVNRTVNFTTTNYSTYQTLDTNAFPTGANNAIRIYSVVPPKQNSLYRLTLTRLRNNATNYTYSLICEKFYIQIL